MTPHTAGYTGTAYGFFHSDASKQAIKAELPKIRKLTQTPSELELDVNEGFKQLNSDPKLAALAKKAKRIGINYTAPAMYLGGTNKDTADEVAHILNQTYQTDLYKEKAPFKGEVAYKEKGDYAFIN